MKNKKYWINLSILNLCVVAFLGMILRSKILFSLPFINYPHLLDAHSHFAFGGWITLALIVLMVYELLPPSLNKRPIYQWLLGSIALNSWIMLFTFALGGNSSASNYFSTLFIIITYFFGWRLIKDIRKAGVNKTVVLLTVSSVIALILSSVGPFALAYLFASKSLNAIFYKDALYTYLHLQYNGFFTLAVFALLFHLFESKITVAAKRNIHRFSVLLIVSILPSLFLSFLWADPNMLFRIIAIAGSIFLVLTLIWFSISAPSILKFYKEETAVVRFIGSMSMSAFALKIFLQSLTIFPVVGNAVFGDRPMIIGFLHLVFLGFVSLFILFYFAQKGILNCRKKFTRFALIAFTLAVVFNEAILMMQGLGAMFIKSSHLFPWLLWITSIWLFCGAVLIAIACFKYNTAAKRELMEELF